MKRIWKALLRFLEESVLIGGLANIAVGLAAYPSWITPINLLLGGYLIGWEIRSWHFRRMRRRIQEVEALRIETFFTEHVNRMADDLQEEMRRRGHDVTVGKPPETKH